MLRWDKRYFQWKEAAISTSLFTCWRYLFMQIRVITTFLDQQNVDQQQNNQNTATA